jgi:hypothetical protein
MVRVLRPDKSGFAKTNRNCPKISGLSMIMIYGVVKGNQYWDTPWRKILTGNLATSQTATSGAFESMPLRMLTNTYQWASMFNS